MTAGRVLHAYSVESAVLSNEESLTSNGWRKSICTRIATAICWCTLGYFGLHFCYQYYKRQRDRNPYAIAEEGMADEYENPITEPGSVVKGEIQKDEREDKEETENKIVCGNSCSVSNDGQVADVGNDHDDHTTGNDPCDSKEVENTNSEMDENVQDSSSSVRCRTNGQDRAENIPPNSIPLDTFSNWSGHSGITEKPTISNISNATKDDQSANPQIAGIDDKKIFNVAAPAEKSGTTSNRPPTYPAHPATDDLPSGGEGGHATSWRKKHETFQWRSLLSWDSEPYKSYTISQSGANVIGFSNLGNTCFFNSMLQCVQQTLPLHEVLREIMTKKEYIIPSTISDPLPVKVAHSSPHQLTKALQHLFHDVNTCTGSLSPREVLSALGRENSRFSRRTQEDSHEALRCLLNAIRLNEISAIKKSIYGHYGVTENPSSHRILDGEEKLSMKDHLSKASKGVSAVDCLIGTVVVSTTICHDCFTPLQIEELCLDLSLPMSHHSMPQYEPSALPLRSQTSNRKKKRRKKKKKKVTTPVVDQHKNVNNSISTNANKPKETTTQPTTDAHKAGVPPKLKAITRALEVKTSENSSEYDSSSDEDHTCTDEHFLVYYPSSSESDDDHSTFNSDSTGNHSDTLASGYSSDEDDDVIFNGYFDLTVSHLFINNDPSSTEEESDEEFEYEIDLLPQTPTTSHLESQPTATDKNGSAFDENGNIIVVTPQNVKFPNPSTNIAADDDATDGTDTTTDFTTDTDCVEQPDEAVLHYKDLLNEFLKEKGFVNAAGVGNGRRDVRTQLELSLLEYTKLDVLDEYNKFICQQCSNAKGDTVECRVSKQNLIHHLPPVLILQMKRFSIGYYNVTKDGRHISFPLILNMAPYCTSDCIQKMADKHKEILYGLYAVVVHHGGTLHGGHYTAYVRQRPRHCYHTPPTVNNSQYDRDAAKTGRWYDISDSWVSSGCTFGDVQRCQAYLLFYELLPVL